MTPVVLVVEDTPTLSRLYGEYMKRLDVSVQYAETGKEALAVLTETPPDVMLLDLQLPDMNGLDILREISERELPTAVVVITANGSIGTAVEAMRAGAYDFMVKPFAAERLTITVRNALERQRLSTMVTSFKDDYGPNQFCGFIGGSLAMQAVYRVIESAARSKATVFITGESGTGKEVCAEAIHQRSPRRDHRFVALNCGAIPKDLMESEIFGHVKGAFTGAIADRDGAATRANGGTLFLDEICEMDLGLQTKLLRFLQTGTLQKVGGSKLETVDVRYICATNRDPWAEVQAVRFREDLYYRLHVIPCPMPALRERDTDILLIAQHFLHVYNAEEGKRFKRLSFEVEAILRNYPWPGNVRQLQNVMRQAVVLHDGEVVTPDMLPALEGAARPSASVLSIVPPAAPPRSTASIRPLWQVERDAIEEAVTLCNGNIPKAAALLDISASTIYRKRLSWDAAEAKSAAGD